MKSPTRRKADREIAATNVAVNTANIVPEQPGNSESHVGTVVAIVAVRFAETAWVMQVHTGVKYRP